MSESVSRSLNLYQMYHTISNTNHLPLLQLSNTNHPPLLLLSNTKSSASLYQIACPCIRLDDSSISTNGLNCYQNVRICIKKPESVSDVSLNIKHKSSASPLIIHHKSSASPPVIKRKSSASPPVIKYKPLLSIWNQLKLLFV